MASINKVFLLGHAGRDTEVRYAPSGTAVATFTLATSRQWKDKTSGEKQEEVEWSRCVAYERTAEVAGEYVKKGTQVHVEGRLKTRKWTDKDGAEKYTTEIIVERLTLLGKREGGDDKPAASKPAAGNAYAATKEGRAPAPAAQKSSTGFDDMDDDIPF
jgi:single-strand DNA-binding protein